MKFAVFTLVIGVCLAIVQANAVPAFPAEENDLALENFIADDDFFCSDDFVDIDTFTFFSGFKKILKNALRSLKGVHCSIYEAIRIKNSAQAFIDDINSCGVQLSKQAQAVVKSCQDIISTVNDIIHLNDNICNGGDYDPETDGDQQTSKNCFWKLLKKFYSLRKQISKTISLIKKVPQSGSQANDCVNKALNTLLDSFTQFPSNVIECSKLTSN